MNPSLVCCVLFFTFLQDFHVFGRSGPLGGRGYEAIAHGKLNEVKRQDAASTELVNESVVSTIFEGLGFFIAVRGANATPQGIGIFLRHG
jgi:hypothetical protein